MQRPLFPGSFDPPTCGHVDLAERALGLFGELTIAVAENTRKTPLFGVAERLALLEDCLGSREGLRLVSFAGLVSDYCRAEGHDLILRGLRNVADFEQELQMALTNRELVPGVETLFLMPSLKYTYTSSTLLKEIVEGGGDASRWLPPAVVEALLRKLRGAGR